MQKLGRALALRAALNVCSDIADGIDAQHCSKLAGPGRHDTMATATRIQQAMRSSVFMANYAVSAGNSRNFLSSPLAMLATHSAHRANAVFTSGKYEARL
jgi:hypothetical protein